MNDLLIKGFTRFNSFLLRITGGKIGSRLGTQSILILHTVGRKTGQPRATPIAYFDYEGKYVLVGSNWGRDQHADWLLNLRGQPRARIEVRGRSFLVHARETQGEEYERFWKFVAGRHAQYLKHQQMTSRRIPIVILEATL